MEGLSRPPPSNCLPPRKDRWPHPSLQPTPCHRASFFHGDGDGDGERDGSRHLAPPDRDAGPLAGRQQRTSPPCPDGKQHGQGTVAPADSHGGRQRLFVSWVGWLDLSVFYVTILQIFPIDRAKRISQLLVSLLCAEDFFFFLIFFVQKKIYQSTVFRLFVDLWEFFLNGFQTLWDLFFPRIHAVYYFSRFFFSNLFLQFLYFWWPRKHSLMSFFSTSLSTTFIDPPNTENYNNPKYILLA